MTGITELNVLFKKKPHKQAKTISFTMELCSVKNSSIPFKIRFIGSKFDSRWLSSTAIRLLYLI